MPVKTIYKEFKKAQDGEQDPSNPKYWYINGKLEETPALVEDVDLPDDKLSYSVFDDGQSFKHADAKPSWSFDDDGQPQEISDDEQPKNRIWFSSTGLTACMHYDTAHNTHSVVYGAKRIMVASPIEWDKAHLHPTIHPSHRQSQILQMTRPNASFSGAQDLRVQETVLAAGETIYIPPYWFHSVQSLTTTVAVSIWTESPEGRLSNALCPLPNVAKQCPHLFMPLWTSDLPDEAIGVAFLAYTRQLLYLLSRSEEVQASVHAVNPAAATIGSLEHLEQGIEQKYGTEQMAGFCAVKAASCPSMRVKLTSKQVAAVKEIAATQFERFKSLFVGNPGVGSLVLISHIEGIASTDAFNTFIATCDWLRKCLIGGMKAKTTMKGFPVWNN